MAIIENIEFTTMRVGPGELPYNQVPTLFLRLNAEVWMLHVNSPCEWVPAFTVITDMYWKDYYELLEDLYQITIRNLWEEA